MFALLLSGCSAHAGGRPAPDASKSGKDAMVTDGKVADTGKDATQCHQKSDEVCDDKDNDCDGETDEEPAGRSCYLSHATARCVDGRCTVGSCDQLYGDCDDNPANGCETPLDMMTNCGQCGRSCLNMEHEIGAMCDKGACAYEKCELRYGDCDSDKSNGCEQKLETLDHCGGCGKKCSEISCAGGVCSKHECPAGFADCDGNADNGCEASLTAVNNCLICGNACSITNATASCEKGTCEFAKCKPGYGNCDGDGNNGCETPLNTINDCGACGTRCSSAGFCTGGKCTEIGCLEGKADCDQNIDTGCEVYLDTIENCGICGYRCDQALGNDIVCKSGICQMSSCESGTYDCDKDSANGCESKLADNKNCGACGTLCSLANATSSCATGTCVLVSCNSRFGDCDGNPATGCETLISDTKNCGKCGVVCPDTLPHATGVSCNEGVCSPSDCESGWEDCNDNAADGCETDVTSDEANCGRCRRACGLFLPNCNGGSCGL